MSSVRTTSFKSGGVPVNIKFDVTQFCRGGESRIGHLI